MAGADDQTLLKAAGDGDLAAVEAALAKGADINARGEYGDSALNITAQRGHKELVQRLLDLGANVDNVGGADLTPLMNAAFAGNIAIVNMLLAKGANVTDDLLMSFQMKVNILEENAESGMVLPEAAKAWRQFLQFLVAQREKQDGAKRAPGVE